MKKACHTCQFNSYECTPVPPATEPCDRYKPVKIRCRGCIKLKELEACMDERDGWRKHYLAGLEDCIVLGEIIGNLRAELELERD